MATSNTRKAAQQGTPDADSIDDIKDKISDFLDNSLFEPLYRSTAGSFETSVSDRIQDYRTFRKIDLRLRNIKVISFVIGVFFFFGAFRCFSTGNLVKGPVYLFLAHDCFYISFNCYIKRYCSLAAKTLGGDFKAFGSTLLKVASNVLGMGGEDPFVTLKKDVMWEVLKEGTVCSMAWNKFSEAMKKK